MGKVKHDIARCSTYTCAKCGKLVRDKKAYFKKSTLNTLLGAGKLFCTKSCFDAKYN